jgi:sRNA-binding protein
MSESDRKERLAAANEVIRTLAELFPAAFAAEKWEPHKPLKIGIDKDLVELGVLEAKEVAQCCGAT